MHLCRVVLCIAACWSRGVSCAPSCHCQVNEWLYPTVNRGVYSCGFATTQQAYDEGTVRGAHACRAAAVAIGRPPACAQGGARWPPPAAFGHLFEGLGRCEALLGRQRFLASDRLTFVDLRLFATLIRFDEASSEALQIAPAGPGWVWLLKPPPGSRRRRRLASDSAAFANPCRSTQCSSSATGAWSGSTPTCGPSPLMCTSSQARRCCLNVLQGPTAAGGSACAARDAPVCLAHAAQAWLPRSTCATSRPATSAACLSSTPAPSCRGAAARRGGRRHTAGRSALGRASPRPELARMLEPRQLICMLVCTACS